MGRHDFSKNGSSATDEFLGTGKWGKGPTAVVLKQDPPWTVGCSARVELSGGGKFDGSAAVRLLHDQRRVDILAEYGLHLQLGNDRLVRSDQLHCRQADDHPQATDHPFGPYRYWADARENGSSGLGGRVALTLLFRKQVLPQGPRRFREPITTMQVMIGYE
ncbi:hypothetical protein ATY81_00720 [Rhizobium sp. R72]|nr:hypothetical protein ATY81_00720 [Rhizobium sp. R72]OWW05608.1 hypothetical protein ATY80_00720 [Rhizobium sp. R711]